MNSDLAYSLQPCYFSRSARRLPVSYCQLKRRPASCLLPLTANSDGPVYGSSDAPVCVTPEIILENHNVGSDLRSPVRPVQPAHHAKYPTGDDKRSTQRQSPTNLPDTELEFIGQICHQLTLGRWLQSFFR